VAEAGRTIEPIRWEGDRVIILDQTRLPAEEVYLDCPDVEQVAGAIRRLAIRGAPLLGIAAAYGLALAAQGSAADMRERVAYAAELLRSTRPTARNLFWAIERMVKRAEAGASADDLLAQAVTIHHEDAEACRLIGEHGAKLLPPGATVLTICNTGSLATGGIGTALGIIRTAHAQGNPVRVIACETRPLLQGARLTMWELQRDGIPATLITDNMAGEVMRRGLVDVVITGADRIARDGDTANKIGTYTLAVLARHHGIPFYVAAPMSTVDLAIADGSQIPVEERDPEEVRAFAGRPATTAGAAVMNPAFDVTPHELITAIITERGVMRPPYEREW
jgi:methylthioribose-1-phosphate isomerase